MTDRRDIEARLLDGLGAEERAALGDVAALVARAAPPAKPPAGLEERTLEAVRAAAGAPGTTSAGVRRRRRSWLGLRRAALAGGLAVALAAAAVVGSLLLGGAEPELEATLTSRSGQSATATVEKTGIGRVIEFRTDELPVLPEGEYYELWFVGPGDRTGAPNRISAGTFHPDEKGRSNVRFTAAVDPAKYPRLAVTAEPGDGDPAPTSPDVMRSSQP